MTAQRTWQQQVQRAFASAGFLLVHVVSERYPWSSDVPVAIVTYSGGERCWLVCDHTLPQQLLTNYLGKGGVGECQPPHALSFCAERVAIAAMQALQPDATDAWEITAVTVTMLRDAGGEAALDTATTRVTLETDDGLRCDVALLAPVLS